MKTSDSIVAIAKALLKVQKAITFAHTDSNNPFFKSKYADLPTVIDAIKPQLNDNEIVYIQTPTPSEPGTLALTTRLLHSSGEWIEDTAIVPLPKADPQGYGSAMTYARRYSLAAITGLYQDDDDGNAASRTSVPMPKAKEVQEPEPRPAEKYREEMSRPEVLAEPVKTGMCSDKQRKMIFAKCKQANIDEDELKVFLWNKFLIESTKDLGWKDIDTVLKWIDGIGNESNPA